MWACLLYTSGHRILLFSQFTSMLELLAKRLDEAGVSHFTLQGSTPVSYTHLFAAASFTDFLDGHVARKGNMVTDFGKFADPLADKLLTTVAFIYMMRDGVCLSLIHI